MTPEDVLIESIAAASMYGDRPSLRQQQCAKLRETIERMMKVRDAEKA